MPIIDAHPLLNRRSANSWNPDWQSISGGVNLNKVEQVITGPVAAWRTDIRLAPMLPADRQALATFLSRLRGRSNYLRIKPRCCPPDALFDRIGMAIPSASDRAGGIPHGDDTFFSDGSGYAYEIPDMTLAFAAGAFDSDLFLTESALERGLAETDWIGLPSGLYRVVAIFPDEDVYRISVEPPLRVSHPAGAAVSLDPSCVMRLAADSGGFVGIDHASPPAVTLSLIEIPGAV